MGPEKSLGIKLVSYYIIFIIIFSFVQIAYHIYYTFFLPLYVVIGLPIVFGLFAWIIINSIILFNFWKAKNWARIAIVIIEGLAIFSNIPMIFLLIVYYSSLGFTVILYAIILCLITIAAIFIIVYLLTNKNAKEYFKN